MRLAVSSRSLSLYEVTVLGEPALFYDYGEALLYESGVLYDIHENDSDAACAFPPEKLPEQILDHGTGIESGWHHLAGCDCLACAYRRAA